MTALALAVAALLAQAEELPPRREVPAEVQRVPTVQLVGPLRAPVPDVRVVEEGAGSGPAPTDFVLLGYRVHVFVSEDLEPDALRRLVRPGVTLWLQTRSNMLRASTVDTLRRAEVAWVQLRPPVLRPHWDQLGKLPRAGVWVQPQHVHGPGMGRRGSHPLALDVRAPVTGESLAQVRPLSTVFRVPVSAAVAQRVPGERLLWGGLAGGCSADPLLKVRMDAPWRPPCGHGVLAQLTRVQLSELQGLYAAHPGVELAVEVADSEAAASGVAALLDVLDAAAARQAAGP